MLFMTPNEVSFIFGGISLDMSIAVVLMLRSSSEAGDAAAAAAAAAAAGLLRGGMVKGCYVCQVTQRTGA